MSFFTDNLQMAIQASSQTHVLTSVILAQWADETGYGTSTAFVNGHNFAGVSYSGVSSFPTVQAGLDAYISTLNLSYYDKVRSASGWQAQCRALGLSPWAAGHYDYNDYMAAGQPADGTWTPPNPGIDLISIVNTNNLSAYDSGATPTGTDGPAISPLTQLPKLSVVPAPVWGFSSDFAIGQVVINGTTADELLGDALIVAQLDLSISQASTVTLTIHDPDRKIIQLPEFSQTSYLSFPPVQFKLVSVEKSGSVLTVTFESATVAALRQATGPYTVAPGTMTRTEFANLIVGTAANAGFVSASESYLYSQDQGYSPNTKEQLCRGTAAAPMEDSWTCLQRLANEIQWVCFETFGTVYFGPYGYLTYVNPIFAPLEFQNGVSTIDGTYDVGQPLGNLTVTCQAGSWVPPIGSCVYINELGPLNGNWLVSGLARVDVLQPDITVTLQQPLPSLPEPSSGGGTPAVAPGTSPTAVTQQSASTASGIYWPVDKSMTPERVDQGKDWGGAGNIYAVTAGTIVNVANSGWPGGAFIVLELAHPPDSTHTAVYYAECITPHVSIGDSVVGGQIIGVATAGPTGVEIGWADPTAIGQSLSARLDGPYGGSGPTPQGTSFVNWITSGTP